MKTFTFGNTIRLLVVCVITIFSQGLIAQVTIINDDHHNHNQVYFSPVPIVSPGDNDTVKISGSSRIIYTSFEKISLRPGFKIFDITNGGRFKASVGEAGFIVHQLFPDTSIQDIIRFERLELGLILPNHINAQVDSFMLNPPISIYESYTGMNPFDPRDISVEAHFVNLDNPGIPEQKVYGFFMKDYGYINPGPDQSYWIENDTAYNWRIRFSPDSPGLWSANIYVHFQGAPELDSLIYQNFEFSCIESAKPGYIIQNEDNPRMLKYSGTGEQFFGIGLNVAWPTKWISPQSGYYYVNTPNRFQDHRNTIRNLANNEGNFTRIVATAFDYNFEWEQLNFYDSKFNTDTVPWGSNNKGAYELVGRQALAYELDSLFLVCEELGISLVYCLEHHFQFGSSHPSYPGYTNYPYVWPKNPYNGIPEVDSAADFFTNEEALLRYKNKLRYIIARWGYSTAIMGIELLSEIDQINCTGAYDDNTAKAWEYCPYSDTTAGAIQFRQNLQAWHIEMYDFMRSDDGLSMNHHLISTSYGNSPRSPDNTFDYMDFTSLHSYRYLQTKNKLNFNIYNNKIFNDQDLTEKPFYMGEMGLSGTSSLGCSSTGYYACDNLSFHNDSWATSMFSGISQGMHWWWDKGIIEHHLSVLTPLKTFFEQIDLTGNNFNQIGSSWQDIQESEDIEVEYYYSHTENYDVIYGWIHNYNVYWDNFVHTHQDCLTDTVADWDQDCIPPDSISIDSVYAEITFENVPIGSVYNFQLFNTRTGEFLPTTNVFTLNTNLTVSFGYLGNDPNDVALPPDYAFLLMVFQD